MTTSFIHLDLLESMDMEAFLMALRQFVSRRGKPFEIEAQTSEEETLNSRKPLHH